MFRATRRPPAPAAWGCSAGGGRVGSAVDEGCLPVGDELVVEAAADGGEGAFAGGELGAGWFTSAGLVLVGSAVVVAGSSPVARLGVRLRAGLAVGVTAVGRRDGRALDGRVRGDRVSGDRGWGDRGWVDRGWRSGC